MPIKTANDLVLLNFNDPNNPLYDECGNTWYSRTRGSIKIIDNPTNFNIYKIGNQIIDIQNALIYCTPKFTLGGNEDFTIDFYFKNNLFNINFSPYWISIKGRKWGVGSYTSYDTYLEYWGGFDLTSNVYYYTHFNKNTTNFCHYALEYHHLEQKVYCFLDGNLVGYINNPILPKFNPSYICIGISSSIPDTENLQNISNQFYFTYFRITKELLYCKNYDVVKKALTSSREINTNHNTKRLFSFKYNLNTSRKTKWNQRVNMYIMDPSIYNKG